MCGSDEGIWLGGRAFCVEIMKTLLNFHTERSISYQVRHSNILMGLNRKLEKRISSSKCDHELYG